MSDNEWKQLDADKYRKAPNEHEREYLIINRDLKRITYVYKYFVLESEDLYKAQQEETDLKVKYSPKYGYWVSERAYIDLDTADLITQISKEFKSE